MALPLGTLEFTAGTVVRARCGRDGVATSREAWADGRWSARRERGREEVRQECGVEK